MPGVTVCTRAHMWTLCVCVLENILLEFNTENKPKGQQTRQREGVHPCVVVCWERRGCGGKKNVFPLFLSAAGTELSDFSVNYPLHIMRRTQHAPRVWCGLEEFGPGKEAGPRWGSRPLESRIWRSLKTSLLNSTPSNKECMWRNEQNLKANRHSVRMCKRLLLEVINHIKYKKNKLVSVTAMQWITVTATVTVLIYQKRITRMGLGNGVR